MELRDKKVAVIGLGYVGLPLAVEFGKHQPTIGFDINSNLIQMVQDDGLHVGRADWGPVAQNAGHLE